MSPPPSMFSPARDAVLKAEWVTTRPSRDIMALLNAIDADTMRPITNVNQLAKRANEAGVKRPSNPGLQSLQLAYAETQRLKLVKWETVWKPRVDAMRADGCSWYAIRNALNTDGYTLRQFRTHYGYKDEPKPVAAPKMKPPPPPPKPRAQTVEEWLAAGGQIKRCPTATVAFTQATIPPADRAALAQYYATQAAERAKHTRPGAALRATTWRASAHIRIAKGLPA